jgi:hypothetical protein
VSSIFPEVLIVTGLEKAALDRWFNGDTSGYRELWSKHSFTYFDGANPDRVEGYDSIIAFLDTIEGKLFAKHYDFCCPRVQFGTDMAVLTYQLFAKTTLIDMQYNCVEVFQKESDDWHVIHSTWSFIRPMEGGIHRFFCGDKQHQGYPCRHAEG